MLLRQEIYQLVDKYTLPEVLERLECVLNERLGKSDNPLADQLTRTLEDAIKLSEKIQDAGLLPRENQWN